MRAEDETRIKHMLEAVGWIIEFMSGRDRRDLDANRMLLLAVVRAIEILGEAASKVTTETKSAAPAVPWQAIVGMRNRIIHAYWDVDTEIVWKTATEEVPALHPQLQALLPSR